jgi:hypothetical protein
MGRPMSEARRMRRLVKQNKVKTVNFGEDRELTIPTEREVEQYITTKITELKNKESWDVAVKEENL